MSLFQLVFAPLCGCASLAMLWRTARGLSLRRSGYFWSMVWLAAGLLILFPYTTTRIARLMGIGRGADLILYIAILAGLSCSFYFYARSRRLEILVTEIIRREALHAPARGMDARGGGQDRTDDTSSSPQLNPAGRLAGRR
jgi:small membrane protein